MNTSNNGQGYTLKLPDILMMLRYIFLLIGNLVCLLSFDSKSTDIRVLALLEQGIDLSCRHGETLQRQRHGPIRRNAINDCSSRLSPRIDRINSRMQTLLEGKDSIYTKHEILERLKKRYSDDCDWAVDQLASADTTNPHLPEENRYTPLVNFEPVTTRKNQYLLAYQSTQPLLGPSSIQTIRQAAENKWDLEGKTSSRFTYQRAGNYEAHLADLGLAVREIIDQVLTEQIYPMIGHCFWDELDNQASLCVYDALYIRYNATEARQELFRDEEFKGAGQPLHRDFGIVSVNIMLNNACEFVGGGTFFENQLRDDYGGSIDQSLMPKGPGYALAHLSGERHAGAATLQGVRDIMVFFITARASSPPRIVQAAMLKHSREDCSQCDGEQHEDSLECVHCRLLHQSMAVRLNPLDGEALQYLANTLIEYADMVFADQKSTSMEALQCAKDALDEAMHLTPCDSRVYNTLARVLERLLDRDGEEPALMPKVRFAYERGVKLLEQAERMGCCVQDMESTIRLNYGLHMANHDMFGEASAILEPMASRFERGISQDRIHSDSYKLYQWCAQRT